MKKYRTLEVRETFQENDEQLCLTFGYNTEGVWGCDRVWKKVRWFMFGGMCNNATHYRRPISKRKIG